jgi:hypothetical protein
MPPTAVDLLALSPKRDAGAHVEPEFLHGGHDQAAHRAGAGSAKVAKKPSPPSCSRRFPPPEILGSIQQTSMGRIRTCRTGGERSRSRLLLALISRSTKIRPPTATTSTVR